MQGDFWRIANANIRVILKVCKKLLVIFVMNHLPKSEAKTMKKQAARYTSIDLT